MENNLHGESRDSYVLARTEEETERLRAQSRMLEEPTHRLLDAVGLKEGMACLDVGCGPGEVMRLMGERVGRTGRVLGLDADGDLGRQVTDQLNATGSCRFDFVEGDLQRVDSIPPQAFSLVFARLLLLHMEDPGAALSRMWQWTRPGGSVGVIDYDFRTVDAYPPCEAVAELMLVNNGVLEKAGRDPLLGAKLPHYFEQSGIGPPDGTLVTGMIRPLAELSEFLKATYRSFLPAALKLGVTTAERSAEFFAGMETATESATSYVLGPLVITAWKRKPDL